ncbi:hypothetical protein DL96DRAFT_1621470 [Flagelloscypha sp. PMI_526]|nr:hypothetical protein DL96DRAFT_1621470 [Flagelloscypha sp. PMI_526]
MPTSLPAEILERIPLFLYHDLSSIAACSLASPVFLPSCRTIRFHSITLHNSRLLKPQSQTSRSSLFLDIIERSPIVKKYVRKVRLLNPQNFAGNDPSNKRIDLDTERNSLHDLLKILPRLSHVTDILIWSHHKFYVGIVWAANPWLESAIASLPSLRTVTTEDSMGLESLSSSLFFQKIKGLSLFISGGDFGKRTALSSPPSLLTFRLDLRNSSPTFDNFMSAPFMKYIDISNVRHLALAKPSSQSPFGSWLSALIDHGKTAFLETLILELDNLPDTVRIPPSSLQNVKNIQLLLRTRLRIAALEHFEAWNIWLSSLFSGCAQKHGVTVTFFLPIHRQQQFEEFIFGLYSALEGKEVVIAIPHVDDSSRPSALTSQLPKGWGRYSYDSEHAIWTDFYELCD